MRLFWRLAWQFHKGLYQLSKGRLGARIVGMPVLILHTIGRKSGRPHNRPLTYLDHEDGFLVAASNGGADHHPAWYLNLAAAGEARVEVQGQSIPVKPREASGEERRRLWGRFKRRYEGYARYEQRTKREIPVVVLERAVV